jgi:NADH:ubiquinone oxidoreductase subunit C
MADDNKPKDAGSAGNESVNSAPAETSPLPLQAEPKIDPKAEWSATAARILGAEPFVTECAFAAVQASPENILGVLVKARDNCELAFDVLLDHMAVDWPEKSQFELIYHLFSTTTGRYLSVVTFLSRESPVIQSASSVWPVAELQEREVYDLFGVLYDGHPDLRRLFLEDDWQGFPLRKDYKDDFMLELVK